jgi:orotate phosphoribosyltransferase
LEIIKAQSLFEGDEFILSSGRKSKYYFNLKTTTLDPEGGGLVADLVYRMVSKDEAEYIGGLASGAIPIIAAVCARSWRDKPIKGFYVRDEAKDHGMKKLIEGHIEDGSRVIIIDDVTTAGGSVMKAVEAVRARNCNVLKIISIVDREEGARERFQQEGLAFVSLFTRDDFPGIEIT